jgi:glycosyltransferase involved in cell wall biosynthesis
MNRLPRICLICNSLSINGANNHIGHVIRALRDRCRFTVLAFSDGSMRGVFEQAGVPIRIAQDPQVTADFADFSYVAGNGLLTSAFLLSAKRQGVPCGLMLHDNWHPEKFQQHITEFEFDHLVTERQMREALRNADDVILPARLLFTRYGDFFSEKTRVAYINNICSYPDIVEYTRRHTKCEARKKFGIPRGDLVFLQVGTVTGRKNQLGAISAFQKFRRGAADMRPHLLIKGVRRRKKNETGYVALVEEYVAKEGLRDCVTLHAVAPEAPYDFFLAADCLVHPSFSELLPQAILEAGAFRLPVIASNQDGIPEFVEHGVSGFLVAPDNIAEIATCMDIFARDAALRDRMGEALHAAYLRDHSDEDFARGYETIFCSRTG